MENENRIPLTRLEACTLMAREAVSLLEGGAEALNSGEELREALALLHSSQDLGDGGALLAWVDVELESARRFAKTGERTKSLVKLDTPLPLPGHAARRRLRDPQGRRSNAMHPGRMEGRAERGADAHGDGWPGGYGPERQNP